MGCGSQRCVIINASVTKRRFILSVNAIGQIGPVSDLQNGLVPKLAPINSRVTYISMTKTDSTLELEKKTKLRDLLIDR